MFKIVLTSLLLLCQAVLAKEITILARDGVATYHIDIPAGWTLKLNDKNLSDTTEPLATVTKENMIVTIHNFPSDSMLVRIPPFAQVTRWKKQFTALDEESISLTSAAWSGFSGLRFEATGKQKQKMMTMIAWSLLIAPQYYHKLNPQQRADLTIKALGPILEMKIERKTLIAMAQSLELLEGIEIE